MCVCVFRFACQFSLLSTKSFKITAHLLTQLIDRLKCAIKLISTNRISLNVCVYFFGVFSLSSSSLRQMAFLFVQLKLKICRMHTHTQHTHKKLSIQNQTRERSDEIRFFRIIFIYVPLTILYVLHSITYTHTVTYATHMTFVSRIECSVCVRVCTRALVRV